MCLLNTTAEGNTKHVQTSTEGATIAERSERTGQTLYEFPLPMTCNYHIRHNQSRRVNRDGHESSISPCAPKI